MELIEFKRKYFFPRSTEGEDVIHNLVVGHVKYAEVVTSAEIYTFFDSSYLPSGHKSNSSTFFNKAQLLPQRFLCEILVDNPAQEKYTPKTSYFVTIE
jgi:hypothetical protein